MRPLFPGEWVALGVLGLALAADVVLIRRGHDPISTVIRRGVVSRLAVVALSAHLCTRIPHDPLSWAGARLTRG